MKTIIREPKLKIQSGKDGVWLHFSTGAGRSASLNLHQQLPGDIIGKILTEWAKEYALKNPAT